MEDENIAVDEIDSELESPDEINPEVKMVEDFANSVNEKLELVKSGEMTIEEFAEACKAELKAMEPAGESDLGGLGGGALDFPELNDGSEEA